jgi:hypothetical protein
MALVTQSQEIHRAAYECQWYQHSKMMKHYLLMIIGRSQRAVYLSACQFYAISLQTFGKVQYLIILLLNEIQYIVDTFNRSVCSSKMKLVHTIMLLTCIWEVSSSNSG